MGLVGRLEDLPIADIVRIVYLSRGTGILDLRLEQGRYSVMFSGGLMVNASSPILPSLRLDLERRLNAGPLHRLLKNDQRSPVGMAALQANLIAPSDLERIIFERVATVVRGLCEVRAGEFEFLARKPALEEIEYDPQLVFQQGGIQPDEILGKGAAGLRTLGTVKQTLKRVLKREPELSSADLPESHDRLLFVLEEHAAIREAIKAAAMQRDITVVEGLPQNAAIRLAALLKRDQFFVSVLSLAAGERESVLPVVRVIKQRNPHLPIVVMDSSSDFRHRHLAFEAGADLYIRKPSGDAEEERAMFAEDLMLVVDRRFAEQKAVATTAGAPIHRGFRLLAQLFKEISDPCDMTQVTLTVLKLAADYVDRGVLFAVRGHEFVTLGKFGVRSNASGLRLQRGELPVLDTVIATGRAFRGRVDEATASQLERAFGGTNLHQAIVLPMLNGAEVVGLLYGDNAIDGREIEDTSGLEVFVSESGFAFDNVLRNTRSLSWKVQSGEFQAAKVH